eukprot:scaffold4073_cov401-Prasinococcus_capsulatus_cf.AAC.4
MADTTVISGGHVITGLLLPILYLGRFFISSTVLDDGHVGILPNAAAHGVGVRTPFGWDVRVSSQTGAAKQQPGEGASERVWHTVRCSPPQRRWRSLQSVQPTTAAALIGLVASAGAY